MSPKISILTPSFNHEKFIGFFIESILAQTFSDFECIIVDDCSSDRNVQEIQKYKDSRIKLVQHSYNRGINASLNTAFENSSGEYLVFLAGDDMLEPNALEVLYKALEQNPNAKAIYPTLIQIDKDNKRLGNTFCGVNKDRYELLHHLFMIEIPLSSPGMSVRWSVCMESLYPLDMSMCIFQDVQMHIKLLLRGGVVLISEKIVLYRYDPRTANISANNIYTFIRDELETSKLLDTFLEIKHIAGGQELLGQIFEKEIKTQNIAPHLESLEFFLGTMALLSPVKLRKMWGYHKIMEAYASKEGASKLKKLYNFEFKDYLKLANYFKDKDNLYNLRHKYKKYKRAFNATLVVSLCLIFCIILLYIKG